jgi:superoxide dismutase, Fe-Mn family
MTSLTRRELLHTAATGVALLSLPGACLLAADEKKDPGPFTLPDLPYAFDALEPHIDAKTMEIHHDRHHKTYVDNLNKAVAGTEWATKQIQDILAHLNQVPEKIRAMVRNNGGGHYNHSLFWHMMSPKGGQPGGALNEAITASFGSLDVMLKQLKEAAVARFGSGWAWVVVGPDRKLKVLSTPNQDSPIMDGTGSPILGVDVWEHAYYLKYQNKRADYVDAWLKVINWEVVGDLYDKVRKG